MRSIDITYMNMESETIECDKDFVAEAEGVLRVCTDEKGVIRQIPLTSIMHWKTNE